MMFFENDDLCDSCGGVCYRRALDCRAVVQQGGVHYLVVGVLVRVDRYCLLWIYMPAIDRFSLVALYIHAGD